MYKDISGVIKYIILVFAGEAILIFFPYIFLAHAGFLDEHLPFVGIILAIPFVFLEGVFSLFGQTDEVYSSALFVIALVYLFICFLYPMLITYREIVNNNNKYLSLFFNNPICPTIILILLIILYRRHYYDYHYSLPIFYTYFLIYPTILINCIRLKFPKFFKEKKESDVKKILGITETILFQAASFVSFFYIMGIITGENLFRIIFRIIIGFLPFLLAHFAKKEEKFQNKLSCLLFSFFLIFIFILIQVKYLNGN